MPTAAPIELPPWARVTEERRGHITRVTAMLDRWADMMGLPESERRAWHDAGRFHDALRDASDAELRALAPGAAPLPEMLHGPAAAARLEHDGEARHEVLAAVRWHTVGSAAWGRLGRALYMADYLDPERPFARRDRAFLEAVVPLDFAGVFRQVVRHRLEWALREGHTLFAETVALWNSVA